MIRRFIAVGYLLVTSASCTTEGVQGVPAPAEGVPASVGEGQECTARSVMREPLWKRVGPLTRDLARGLELAEDELCNELGTHRCAEIYKIPLGGSDAARQGVNLPPSEPLLTTALAVERVVLSACVRRVDADRAGSPVVFDKLDLALPTLSLTDDVVSAAVTAQILALHRRMLSRNPTEGEISRLKELVLDADGQPVSARDFAVLACFAIGTSTDFLFI